MRPAIVAAVRSRSPDIPVEVLAHRGRAHQVVERRRRDVAVLVVAAVDADDQIVLGFVVADPLYEAAPVDIPAFEWAEVDRATIPDLYRFEARLGMAQKKYECCRCPDHAACAGRSLSLISLAPDYPIGPIQEGLRWPRAPRSRPNPAETRRNHTSLDSHRDVAVTTGKPDRLTPQALTEPGSV